MVFKKILLTSSLLVYPFSVVNAQMYPIPTVCFPTPQIVGSLVSDSWDPVLYAKEISENNVILFLFQKDKDVLFLKEYLDQGVSCILGIGGGAEGKGVQAPGDPT